MHRIVIALLICVLPPLPAAWSATYYVDAASSGDGNAGSTPEVPWKTLDKVNAAALKSGDSVLFRAGGVWEGTLLPRDGVRYGSYGDAAGTPDPLIRASSAIGDLNWSLHQGRIYVADVSSRIRDETDLFGAAYPASVAQLYYNGQRLQRARYPNVGGGAYGKGQNRFLRMGAGTPVRDDSTVQTMALEPQAFPSSVQAADLVGAQAFVKSYPWYMTRYTVTSIDRARTRAVLTGDASWASGYRISPYQGYWLENKLWMLDREGEWVFDAASRKLYVWLPGGVSPAGTRLNAAVRVHAVRADNVRNVILQNLTVGESRGDAVAIDGVTSTLTINKLSVLNAGAAGIVVKNNGGGKGVISSTLVSDSVNAGIDLGASNLTSNIDVVDSTILRAGRGYFAGGALWLGHASKATGNVIDQSSHVAIRAAKANLIADNLVTNSCMAFDDCGAIYTRGVDYDGTTRGLAEPNDVGSTIRRNFVVGATLAAAPDRLDGLANADGSLPTESAVKGIYLDDYSGAVTVTGNHVSGFDFGVMLHHGRNNTIKHNDLVGNERSQIWLQEDRDPGRRDVVCRGHRHCNPDSYTVGNVISGNVMASRLPGPLVMHHADQGGGSEGFATYANNVYASYGSPQFARDVSVKGQADKSFRQWQRGGMDKGSSLFATSFGLKPASGGRGMVANGGFEQNTAGWLPYSGALSVGGRACPSGGHCMTVTQVGDEPADGNGKKTFGFYTDPSTLSLQEGKQYMVSFQARASGPGEGVYISFSAPSKPYASNVAGIELDTAWRSYSRVLTANDTLGGVRLNFGLSASAPVHFANIRLAPAQTVSGRAEPVGLYNATAAKKTVGCPVSDAAACARYVDVRTGVPVSFPLVMEARTSKVLVLKNPLWIDADLDGVPGDGTAGGLDRCAESPEGASVSESGCAAGQKPVP